MQGLPLQAFMQGLQPAQVVFAGNPFGMMAPQYPAMAPVPPQAPPQAQFPAPADQPWFQALVAAVSKAVIKDIEKLNAPPAAAPADKLSPDNEKILVDALKKGKEDKLPMEQIFQDLCKKHGYTENMWMKWFATNVDKLYPKLALPKANPERAAVSNASRGSSGSSNQAASAPRSASSNRPTTTFRFVPEKPQAGSRKVAVQTPAKPPASSTQAKSTTAASARAALPPSNGSSSKAPSNPSRPPVSQNASSATQTPYSANRSKRGGSVPIVHDQTLIPWSDGSVKPSAPRSDSPSKIQLPRRTSVPQATGSTGPGRTDSGTGTKPTDDEKIFFVHWLRWRLREGPLPEKDTLFEELEAELPHRSAETWKKHWTGNCEVPDALYIAARKRVNSEREREGERGGGARGESPPTPLAVRNASDGSGSGSGSESSGGEDLDPTYPTSASAHKPAATKNPATGSAGKRPIRHLGGLRVTQEDLRAMARFRFGKGREWEELANMARWREFAARPENGKRSVHGWRSISLDKRHSAAIDEYVKELEDQAAAEASRSKSGPSLLAASAASQQNKSVTAPLSGAAKPVGEAKTAQKRVADPDVVDGNSVGNLEELPPSKRKKTGWDGVNPADIVDLTGDSDKE